jgi:hypothetical protein
MRSRAVSNKVSANREQDVIGISVLYQLVGSTAFAEFSRSA